MRLKAISVLSLGLAGGLSGCGAHSTPPSELGPPAGYGYAVAMADCAPWDALAVTLYLTPTRATSESIAPPFLRVSVYSSPRTVAGRAFEWTGSMSQVGTASRCQSGSACLSAEAGGIRFDSPRPDSSLAGTVDVRFPDGSATRGSFQAGWRGPPALCG